MNLSFSPIRDIIVVPVELTGPAGSIVVQLALNTAATHTTLNEGLLTALGFDVTKPHDLMEAATSQGVEQLPRFVLPKIAALGQERMKLFVLGRTLPPRAGVDGFLGLNFLRGMTLTINFWDGVISLT